MCIYNELTEDTHRDICADWPLTRVKPLNYRNSTSSTNGNWLRRIYVQMTGIFSLFFYATSLAATRLIYLLLIKSWKEEDKSGIEGKKGKKKVRLVSAQAARTRLHPPVLLRSLNSPSRNNLPSTYAPKLRRQKKTVFTIRPPSVLVARLFIFTRTRYTSARWFLLNIYIYF